MSAIVQLLRNSFPYSRVLKTDWFSSGGRETAIQKRGSLTVSFPSFCKDTREGTTGLKTLVSSSKRDTVILPWVVTYASILGRMNAHVSPVLMFTRGYRVLTHSHFTCPCVLFFFRPRTHPPPLSPGRERQVLRLPSAEQGRRLGGSA